MGSDMTEQEAEELIRQISDGKHSVHTFLNNVVKAKDTTKTGYLKDEEIGLPTLPVRTYKELSVFCKDVAGMDYFGDYFDQIAEVQTETSLSRDAMLIKLAVTTKRELADVTPTKKENKGWFKPKNQAVSQPMTMEAY